MNVKIKKLKIKEGHLKAQLEMAQARENKQRRKNETRKKILVGAYFLDQYEKQKKMELLIQRLDKYLIRNMDRRLFDLPPVKEKLKSRK